MGNRKGWSEMTSTVAIVGGNGQIARMLTELLVDEGSAVRSIVRNAEQVDSLRGLGAEPLVCDLERATTTELAGALTGCDAVVFAAGAGPGSGAARKHTVDFEGSVKSMRAAVEAGVTRFVQTSFIGAEDAVPTGTDEVFAAYWDAKRAADEALRAEALDWTIVKPGMLTDDEPTGCGELSFRSVGRGAKTRRADVAKLLQLVLAEPRTIGLDIRVSEGDEQLEDALSRLVEDAQQ